jgi:membrane-associated phospholipid phosphatase
VGPGELEVMGNIADERSTGLTATARVVTWAGSAFVLVPLALICCLVLRRVHYPSDVAVGAAIGIVSGVLTARLPRWVCQRRMERGRAEVVR